eukprot:8234586-Heterocapsa_arctica.AAC.1
MLHPCGVCEASDQPTIALNIIALGVDLSPLRPLLLDLGLHSMAAILAQVEGRLALERCLGLFASASGGLHVFQQLIWVIGTAIEATIIKDMAAL